MVHACVQLWSMCVHVHKHVMRAHVYSICMCACKGVVCACVCKCVVCTQVCSVCMCAHVDVRVSEPACTPLLALCTLERCPHALSPWPCRVCDSQALWALFMWKCLDFEGCFPKINRKFFNYKLLVFKTLFAAQNSGLLSQVGFLSPSWACPEAGGQAQVLSPAGPADPALFGSVSAQTCTSAGSEDGGEATGSFTLMCE